MVVFICKADDMEMQDPGDTSDGKRRANPMPLARVQCQIRALIIGIGFESKFECILYYNYNREPSKPYSNFFGGPYSSFRQILEKLSPSVILPTMVPLPGLLMV